MMANEEDYENVVFSDYDDFDSEYEKGKAIIDPNIDWNSDPLLKISLSHPSKIPPPRPPYPSSYHRLQPSASPSGSDHRARPIPRVKMVL